MADDPGHKAMLYFLEILMNSSVPLSISQLAGRFGSRSFTPEMRQSSGGNEAGLKKFLLKYPSLFSVNGNFVSLNDGTASLGSNFRESSPASTSSSKSLPEVSVETEAVQYFRSKMLKKDEKWILIKSIAGHLSQSSADVRDCVGPQSEFRDWLLKHPLIFAVNGDMVSLKDNVTYSAVNPNAEPIDDVHLRYPVAGRDTPMLKRRPKSLDISAPKAPLQRTGSSAGTKAGPIAMTANEYKAVMFIKGALEKRGDMSLDDLCGHFSQAPESLRNTTGWSQPELGKFLLDHNNIFVIDSQDMVTTVKNARLNVIITGSRPQAQTKPTVINRKGKIYHVAKLWAIIDLGKHEHVFIDRCIFGKHVDDLNKYLTTGEMVSFNATPAAKGSRAKWKATKVWREHESFEDLMEKVSQKYDATKDSGTPGNFNIDEEMQKFIPELNDSVIASSPVTVGGLKYAFSDAAPSGAGIIPVWNCAKHSELDGLKDVEDLDLSDDWDADLASVTMVAERFQMNRSVLDDSPQRKNSDTLVNGEEESPEEKSADAENGVIQDSKPKMVDSCCQTIVTGDILATQLCHEDL